MTTGPAAGPSDAYFCPRDPQVETNLRCGKCGQFICPKCLVQTPVGARCPDCARPVKNPAFNPSSGETARAVVAGAAASVGLGVVLSLLSAYLFRHIPYGLELVSLLGLASTGYVAGETVYRLAGYKRSRNLSYLAGACVFMGWVAAVALYPAGYIHLWALLGLGIGVYVAMGRVRV